MPEHLALVSTGDPELSATSESEEMYLITVARAVESGRPEPIPMPMVAEALLVSVTSANEMVRKLLARGLMTYEPYHGVALTQAGWTVAGRVLRTRRLWATFLAEQLGFSPAEADEQACHLEHATSAEAVDRLATFLGDPETDPLGALIPTRDLPRRQSVATVPLSEVAVGLEVEVIAVGAKPAAREFLSSEGIAPGSRIRVLATGETGVLIDAGATVNLARDLTGLIDVRPVGHPDGD
jgi:DtxR family Mn-dependent transcriptional regulator